MRRAITSPKPKNCDGDAGFTLVELLVSIALLSLLSILLLDGVRSGIASWQRSTRLATDIDEISTIQNFLRRLIEETYPQYLIDNTRKGYVEFEGTAQSVSLLSFTPIALGGAGRTKYQLTIEHQKDQKDLVITSQMELADPGSSSKPSHRTIVPNVDTVTFAYFASRDSNSAGQWHESWVRQSRLPQLVRIKVAFPREDPRSWPELIVAPKITTDVGCVYDPLTKACRGR